MARVDPPGGSRSEEASLGGTFEDWTARGADATQRGDFLAALGAYTRAHELVLASGDALRLDKADLNLAMVRIQLGQAREGEDGLREILLRTTDTRIAFSAAYNLASSLRKQGKLEHASRYARRALERAQAIGSEEMLAPVHNLLGNILLNQNYLEEALREYQTALTIRGQQDGDTRYSRAILSENIGYCLILKKDLEEGLNRIREALALAEEVGDRRCQAECLQDLCYGLLLRGEVPEAMAMGEAALERAKEAAYGDIEENCHYLLGELGAKMGDLDRRDRHFESLQSLHPEIPFLKEFLCAVDVTGMITLKR
jgi:tetratricopeptide (TPR) repeat protein